MDDYKESQRESQTEREHDEWEQLGEDTTEETAQAIFWEGEQLEKETDY